MTEAKEALYKASRAGGEQFDRLDEAKLQYGIAGQEYVNAKEVSEIMESAFGVVTASAGVAAVVKNRIGIGTRPLLMNAVKAVAGTVLLGINYIPTSSFLHVYKTQPDELSAAVQRVIESSAQDSAPDVASSSDFHMLDECDHKDIDRDKVSTYANTYRDEPLQMELFEILQQAYFYKDTTVRLSISQLQNVLQMRYDGDLPFGWVAQ